MSEVFCCSAVRCDQWTAGVIGEIRWVKRCYWYPTSESHTGGCSWNAFVYVGDSIFMQQVCEPMNGPPEKHRLRLSSNYLTLKGDSWNFKHCNMARWISCCRSVFWMFIRSSYFEAATGGFRVVPDFFTKEDSGRHSGKLPIRRIPIPCKIGWFLFPCFDGRPGRPGRPWWFSQTDRSLSHGITPRSVTSSWTRPIGVLPSAALQGSSIPTSRDWTVPRRPPGDLGWFKLELVETRLVIVGIIWHIKATLGSFFSAEVTGWRAVILHLKLPQIRTAYCSLQY